MSKNLFQLFLRDNKISCTSAFWLPGFCEAAHLPVDKVRTGIRDHYLRLELCPFPLSKKIIRLATPSESCDRCRVYSRFFRKWRPPDVSHPTIGGPCLHMSHMDPFRSQNFSKCFAFFLKFSIFFQPISIIFDFPKREVDTLSDET